MGRRWQKEENRLTGALITSGLFVHGNEFCRDDMILFIVVLSRLHDYFLPYIYRSDWRGTWPRHVTSMDDYAYSTCRSLSDQQHGSITLTWYLLYTCTCDFAIFNHQLASAHSACVYRHLSARRRHERPGEWDLDAGNSSETRGC